MKHLKMFLTLLLTSLFFIPVTRAEVIESTSSFNEVPGGTTVSVPANSTKDFKLQLYNYEGTTRPYVYLTFSICTNGPTNFSLYNVGYSNYFLDDSLEYFNANKSCKVSNYNGSLYYVQVKVGKYEDLDGTGGELVASSFFRINNPWTYGTYYHIKNFYLSSEDTLTAMRNNKQILDKFNAIEDDLNTMNNNLSSINNILSNNNNKLDETNNKLDSTNNKLDSILDSSSPDLGGLSNSNTWLPQGPVDSIIMLPLNFINTLVSKIGSTCSPVNLPLPFVENKYLTLPCMSTIFGQIENFSTLYDLIGVIGSVYLLYNYLLKFYKWIDDTLSFRENNWQDWGGE